MQSTQFVFSVSCDSDNKQEDSSAPGTCGADMERKVPHSADVRHFIYCLKLPLVASKICDRKRMLCY